MRQRCLGVFTTLFRGCGAPGKGPWLNSEPDLTGSTAEGAKEAVVAMNKRDSEWIRAAQRCCDCAGRTGAVARVHPRKVGESARGSRIFIVLWYGGEHPDHG